MDRTKLKHAAVRDLTDEALWTAKRLGYVSDVLYEAERGRRERERRVLALAQANLRAPVGARA